MECQDVSSLGNGGEEGQRPRGVRCLVPSLPQSPSRQGAQLGLGLWWREEISWHPILRIATLTFIARTGMEVVKRQGTDASRETVEATGNVRLQTKVLGSFGLTRRLFPASRDPLSTSSTLGLLQATALLRVCGGKMPVTDEHTIGLRTHDDARCASRIEAHPPVPSRTLASWEHPIQSTMTTPSRQSLSRARARTLSPPSLCVSLSRGFSTVSFP